jgi:hypothetical protein
MVKSGRLIGSILLGVGIVVGIAGTAVVVSAVRSTETPSSGGLILGLAIVAVVTLPLLAVGVYLIVRGRAEEVEQVDISRQRKILDMVKTRGQVNISDLVLELRSSSAQVRDDIYNLVGLGLFTGYVNWKTGVLYSVEASQLTGNKCPNCGGEQAFAGKGVITCQYCGSQVFL